MNVLVSSITVLNRKPVSEETEDIRKHGKIALYDSSAYDWPAEYLWRMLYTAKNPAKDAAVEALITSV